MAIDKLTFDENDFDFGFSALDEDELDAVQQAETISQEAAKTQLEFKTVQEKNEYLYQMVTSLLRKLGQNAEKEYIYWPNREEAIQKALERVNDVMVS